MAFPFWMFRSNASLSRTRSLTPATPPVLSSEGTAIIQDKVEIKLVYTSSYHHFQFKDRETGYRETILLDKNIATDPESFEEALRRDVTRFQKIVATLKAKGLI
jgi:hypothetical protein